MNSESKGRDRISELPDEVLSHILSYLPTKYSLRTSIVSKGWKNVWASVPDLEIWDMEDLDILDMENRRRFDETGFTKFVDQVMNSPHSCNIRRFSLRCSFFDDLECIDRWLCIAVERNVVEVDLHVDLAFKDRFEFPWELVVSKTLQILKLDIYYVMNLPISGSFPSLRCLHIKVDSENIDIMGTLITLCPVLEDLIIDGTLGNWDSGMTSMTVSAAKLNDLRIRLTSISSPDDWQSGHTFLISAPKLEYLDIEEERLSKYTLCCNTESLVKVHIRVPEVRTTRSPDVFDCVTALMSAVSNVKQLSLSTEFLEDLRMPNLGYLSHLKLHTKYYRNYWELQHLLEKIPKLEFLFLRYEMVRKDVTFQRIVAESVPSCLTSHVKNISIRGLKANPNYNAEVEMDLLKYMLRNCEVLEQMTIYADDLGCSKEELIKEVSMFEKGSKACEVEYIRYALYGWKRDSKVS